MSSNLFCKIIKQFTKNLYNLQYNYVIISDILSNTLKIHTSLKKRG